MVTVPDSRPSGQRCKARSAQTAATFGEMDPFSKGVLECQGSGHSKAFTSHRRAGAEAGGWRELAACNWSGHQTCLSIVNLPAPIPAPVDKPGHGRPVSGLRAPGFTGLQRPRIPASSGNYLHNYRHSEILSTDCVGALRQSRHTFSRLTLRPPGQSCIGPAIPTSETGRLMLRATISPQSHTANKGHSQNLNPEPIRSKNLSGSSVHGAPRLC